MNDSRGIDYRTRMYTSQNQRAVVLFPKLGGTGEVNVGVVSNDASTTRHRQLALSRCHNDTGRLGGGQLLLVTRIAQKAQVLGTGTV